MLNRTVSIAHRGFHEYLRDPELFNRQVSTSRFQYQKDAWKCFFPEDQIHVIFLEDLMNDEDSELMKLSSFLGISFEDFNDVPRIVENSYKSRHVRSTLQMNFANSHFAQVARRYCPDSIRNVAKNSFLKAKPMQLECANWPPDIWSNFCSILEVETAEFLVNEGKPKDFYRFN